MSNIELDLLKDIFYSRYLVDNIDNNTEIEDIRNNQRLSLDPWLEYFFINEDNYPFWFINYILHEVVMLGEYDTLKEEYNDRCYNSFELFPYFDKNIVINVYKEIISNYSNGIRNKDISSLKENKIFKKLYSNYVRNNYGKWVKYDYKGNYFELWSSIQNKPTGWCTVSEDVCKRQIDYGNFYVYYKKDYDGNFSIPKIAIRTDKYNNIVEIRGTNHKLNLDLPLVKVLEDKWSEFNNSKKYYDILEDLKKLKIIFDKDKNKIKLTKSELKFLYEINDEIKRIGWYRDPVIEDIIDHRNIKLDLSIIYNCSINEVAITQRDLYKNNIKVVYNDLVVTKQLQDDNRLDNIEVITGSLYYKDEVIKGLNNLKIINKNAYFYNLKDSKGLENLKVIGGHAYFEKLESASGLCNLMVIKKHANFSNLSSYSGLENLKYIGGNAYFNNVKCLDSDLRKKLVKTLNII